MERAGVVSIPYRLATNHNESLFVAIHFLFQFLIGWLQTRGGIECISDIVAFQFLIGWLQTERKKEKEIEVHQVSIPYRLATNEIAKEVINKEVKKFQFLIGWLQTG